jgi:Domain of unknown function DUF29
MSNISNISNISVDTKLYNMYEKDLYLWGQEHINLLKQGRLNEIDIEHLIEEIEDMGRSQQHAIYSHQVNLIMHLLKWDYQSNIQSHSWKISILNARISISRLIKTTPSLQESPLKNLNDAYEDARELASNETGIDIKKLPKICPYTIEEILNKNWLPMAE